MRQLHAKFKNSQKTQDYDNYSECRCKLNRLKREVEGNFLLGTLGDMMKTSQKRFWSYIKCKTKGQHCSVPTLKKCNGEHVSDPVEKANLLNAHFQSVFTAPSNKEAPHFTAKTDQSFSLKNIQLSKIGIVKLIEDLNQYKSTGPDGISPKLLKLAPDEFADYLLLIFKKCFDLSTIPSKWKVANVTPIFKKGSRSSPENYRPISLTSVVCKMFEHIITSNLATYLEQNNLFNKDQFGFRKNRSCELQLHRVCQDLAFILDNGEQADLIFLDFSKAFDKVSHRFLLSKLGGYGLKEDIISLIKSFLSGRSQKVVIDGYSSTPIEVASGVPQGSVLGPLLFLIYINDLPDKLKSKCRLFADDSLLYRKILTDEDYKILQDDLREVMDWCCKWEMTLNLQKCEHMQLSSKRCPIVSDYKLSDHQLSKVTSYKYLGLHISNNLDWNKHINSVTAKANKVLYVTKLALGRASIPVKEAAYKTIVRPLVEYSSSVWDPYQIGQIKTIEMVQRKAARFCLNRYQHTDSVSSMISDLKWDSLAARRKASRLSVFHRAYNGDNCINDINSHIVRAPMESFRYSHPFRIQSITCHKNIGHYSFLPRSIREWNSLPQRVFNVESMNSISNFRASVINL
jgi:Reverse transcriptase (RNA-dependent DNA polymerase)